MGKLAGFGTELQMSDMEVIPTFNIIAYVKSMGGPSLKVDTEDVTTLEQATAWEEVVATIIRSGEISLEIVYDPAEGTHDATTGLLLNLAAKAVIDWKIVWPNHPTHTTWLVTALITGFEPGAPVEGGLTATVTLKPTGAVTLP